MRCVAAVVLLLAAATPPSQGFSVGIKGTKCNLDPSKGEVNDPCDSLYGAVCRGSHCACPAGTFEDKALVRCSRTRPGGSKEPGGGGRVDDLGLPFDYEPNKPAPAPAPAPAPPKPKPPQQPQPGYNPNQPGYNPNQPGYDPTRPGPHDKTRGKGGKDHMGEEVGGGVGGFVMLLILGGLIYFCCCRGGKHKQVMNRFQGLPFMNRGQQAVPGGAVPMQSSAVQQGPNFSSQHTYIPPDGQKPPDQYPPPAGVYPAAPYAAQPGYAPYPPQGVGPPMQPYPPQPYPPAAAPYVAAGVPEGYPAEGQQPPPYTQQYQPNAPPAQ